MESTREIAEAIQAMNDLPDISGNDSEQLKRFCEVTAREIKVVGGVSAGTSLEMIAYIRELEIKLRSLPPTVLCPACGLPLYVNPAHFNPALGTSGLYRFCDGKEKDG